jgi:LCP family protein required for cell wall assembly
MSARSGVAVFAVLLAAAGCAWGLIPGLRNDALAGVAAAQLARNAVQPLVLDEPLQSGAALYLVVGSDRRDEMSRSDPDVLGQRADAVMLWVLSPQGALTVLSLPRDIRVHLDGHGDLKLGATLDVGPDGLLGAVRELTGLPVHHYVEVEFAGLAAAVDGLGGVPLTLPAPARDTGTGLDLGGGRQVLDGRQVLAYVRSRHYETLIDGRWMPAPGDLGRIERQQQVLGALLGILPARCGSPFGCLDVLRSLGASVTVDAGFDGGDVRQFVAALWRPDTEVSASTLPTQPERAPDDALSPFPPTHAGSANFRALEQPAASEVLDRLRHAVEGGSDDG